MKIHKHCNWTYQLERTISGSGPIVTMTIIYKQGKDKMRLIVIINLPHRTDSTSVCDNNY